MEYRIIESLTGFYVERKQIHKSFFGKTIEKWVRLNSLGYNTEYYGQSISMPSVRFDTLSEARKFVKKLDRGIIVHDARS